jgi:hypothetical protein
MLTCPTHLPIYFCTTPVDFRQSFDGLTGVITAVFGSSVLDSHLFLFIINAAIAFRSTTTTSSS